MRTICLALFMSVVGACAHPDSHDAAPPPQSASGEASPVASQGAIGPAPMSAPVPAVAAPARVPEVAQAASASAVPAAPVSPPVQGGGGWGWVQVDGARCRDGSPTGFAVSSADPTKLLLFFEGGGLCVNPETCSHNQAQAHAAHLGRLSNGVFDRSRADNPVASWSQVFFPYCTGDFWAGNNQADVPGVGPQIYDGYANVGLFLARMKPLLPRVSEVLLAGASAGGFGATLNWSRVSAAFPGAAVTLVDDSGPLFASPYFAPCWQDQLRKQWGLDRTILAGRAASGDFFSDYFAAMVRDNPSRTFGVIDSAADRVISRFYGWGAGGCGGRDTPIAASDFTRGLLDMRGRNRSQNFGTFLFPGFEHTSLAHPTFYERTATGPDGRPVSLPTWLHGLVAGKPTHVGP